MRKLLVALMLVAFAATAFAADVTFSGSYEFDGKYQKGYGQLGAVSSYSDTAFNAATDDRSATNQYYEHDFDLWMNVQTDKDTFFKTKMELVDDTIGTQHYADNGDKIGVGSDAGYAANTQFSVQRVWMGHNFGGVLLEAGLMDSGAWGYSFGDNVEGSYRVKGTFDVAGGKLIMLTQKKTENGSDYNTKGDLTEKDDADKYSIGYKGTFNGLFIAPKLDYDVNSDLSTTSTDGLGKGDTKVIDFDVAAGKSFGALALQAEYQLKSTTVKDGKDYDIYGWYLGGSYKMGKTTVGALSAYGSVSKDNKKQAYDFNDDFDSTFILGDDLSLGSSQGGDLTGFWANAVYTTYEVSDKLNVMGKLAYATSNWKKDSAQASTANANLLHGASAWEADASANYAITKELSYYVNAGYAKVALDSADPDAIILVKHGLVLSF